MKISDIFKLNNEVESLNIINEYLSRTITHEDYEAAIYMYLKIAKANQLHDLVISEGTKSLEKVKDHLHTEYREKIYHYLINSAIALNKFDDAKKYIEDRKELLPILTQYTSLLDELKLAKASNNDYFDILVALKNETIPQDIRILIFEELLNQYLNKKDFTEALTILNELKEISLKKEYDNIYIQILYHLEEYMTIVDLVPPMLENEIPEISCVVYLIASLIKLNRLLNASTLEAEFEKDFDKIEDIEFKKFTFETIIKLYTLMDNKISIDLYNRKLQRLNRQTTQPIKEEKVVEKQVIQVKEIQTQSLISNAKYIEHFEWILNWLLVSHEFDLKLSFREYLRKIFILISEKITFKEVILYYNDKNYESNFYNYKKERLYDKTIIRQYIEGSIISDVLKNKNHYFGSINNLLSRKDVLTQKDFDESVGYVYSFYINDNAVITFYLDDIVTDPSLYFDLFNGISYIINTRIIDENNSRHLQTEARYLEKIFNNKVIASRQLSEYQSKYNDVAASLFNIDNKYHLELFLRQMSLEDAKKYEAAVARLFSYPNEVKELTYQFNSLVIKEYMFAIKENNKTIIYSYFIDLTKHYKKEDDLLVQATVCNETKLNNKNALFNNLPKYLKNKTTFVLLELNTELSSVYGNELMNQFFIEFSLATSKHFVNADTYRFDFNQLMIVFDYNDIRTINKELDNYFLVVNHLDSKVLKYESFKAKAGVLRYPVVTVEKNINRLFRYLGVSLQKAKLKRQSNYSHFIQSDYEQDIFEQEVIDYINTAIENKQLTIKFKQIIDIEKNVVWNYESLIYLPNINVDIKYLNIIAKRRRKIVSLELYHVEAVCSFLNKLEEETKHLVRLTIPISEETFKSSNFVSFIIGTLKKYKIPAEFIRILVDLKETSQSDSLMIDELIKYGISVDTTSVNAALKNDFNAVHLKFDALTTKQKTYYKQINELLNSFGIACVIKEVNSKEDRDQLKNLGLSYIEGIIYQEIMPIELVTKIKDAIK